MSSLAVCDPSTAGTIAIPMSSTIDFPFASSTDVLANSILSTTTSKTSAFVEFFHEFPSSSSLLLSLLDGGAHNERKLMTMGSIHNPEYLRAFLLATFSRVSEIINLVSANAKNNEFEFEFETISNQPITIISTIALVTASDMVPFVPCQPLAISLGARYGAWAFPVCVVGQTLAGVLAFQSSRSVSDAEQVQKAIESLGDESKLQFQKFRTESLLGNSDSNSDTGTDERTVFFALVGLRLAPFFPFSAGNYLLGGATDVGLRPFVLATILGCMVSNVVSVLLGMGGAELWMTTANN